MKTRSYKDLIVWQKSIDLVQAVYDLTRSFPKEEMYGLTLQIRRAVVSLPSNIAEGYARQHTNEYIQFLAIAYGSAAELETQLIVAEKLGYINGQTYEEVLDLLVEVSKMLNSMMNSLKNKIPKR